jgi:hypothetical protein
MRVPVRIAHGIDRAILAMVTPAGRARPNLRSVAGARTGTPKATGRTRTDNLRFTKALLCH